MDDLRPVDVLQMPLAASRDEADRRHAHAATVLVDQHVAPARVQIAPADQAAAADIADLFGIARDEPGGEDARLDTGRFGRGVRGVAVGGGVRNERRASSASRPPARSSVSSTAVARGSWIGCQLPRSRMCHRSSPPMTTERVGRSTIAPGPKAVISCDWRSVMGLVVMPCLPRRRPVRHRGRAA